jgi:hypothetical protein
MFIPLLLRRKHPFFNSDPRRQFCKAGHLRFRSKSKTCGIFTPKKEGAALKSNSPRIGAHQSQNSFYPPPNSISYSKTKRVWPPRNSRCQKKCGHQISERRRRLSSWFASDVTVFSSGAALPPFSSYSLGSIYSYNVFKGCLQSQYWKLDTLHIYIHVTF